MTGADRLQKIIDTYAPKYGDHFFEWVGHTLSATDWNLFAAALGSGDYYTASNLVRWEEYNPSALISETVGVAGQAHASHISDITNVKYVFDIEHPDAVQWAGEHGGKLVVQIDDPTRKALKEVIHRGFFSGRTPHQQATFIKGMVGLDDRRVKAVDNYMTALRRKGLSDREISEKALRYSDKLLNTRAKTIAVNEASEAASHGQYFSTKDACDRGIIDPLIWQGARSVIGDTRTCERCSSLAGETRKLPNGTYPSSGSVTPKLHVLCRCYELMQKISKKEMVETGQKNGVRGGVSSHIEGIFRVDAAEETDTSILIPTVPVVEGVFSSGYGFPVLRLYDEFKESARWLNGLAVVVNHDYLDADVRRVGQMQDAVAEDDKRRIKTTTEIIRQDLTQREAEQLLSGKPAHGSLRFACYLEHVSGVHNGVLFEAVERGPYVYHEYSLVKQGVVTPDDGAGFNIESKPGGNIMAIENEITEVVETDHVSRVEFEVLQAGLKDVSEKNAELKGVIEANQKARDVLVFRDLLKPGHQDEAGTLLETYADDPIGWLKENADKLVTATENGTLKGKLVSEGPVDVVEIARQNAEDVILRRK